MSKTTLIGMFGGLLFAWFAGTVGLWDWAWPLQMGAWTVIDRLAVVLLTSLVSMVGIVIGYMTKIDAILKEGDE